MRHLLQPEGVFVDEVILSRTCHLSAPVRESGRREGLSQGVSVRVADADDQHGCSSQQYRDPDHLQDHPEPLSEPGFWPHTNRTETTEVPVLPATTTRYMELRTFPSVLPESVPTLSHGSESVLGIRRSRQTPLDEAIPPGPGLRPSQREDQLVPRRKSQRVR